jgi:outer membrane immunogenic protein
VDPTIIHEPNAYDLRWTTHLRGRAGVTVDNWLFYVAGGYALADLAFHQGATIVIPASTSNNSNISSDGGKYHGWTIGGGIETAVTRNLHGRVEYLFDDLGHKDYVGVNGDAYRVSFRSQTVRGALIWKFD